MTPIRIKVISVYGIEKDVTIREGDLLRLINRPETSESDNFLAIKYLENSESGNPEIEVILNPWKMEKDEFGFPITKEYSYVKKD